MAEEGTLSLRGSIGDDGEHVIADNVATPRRDSTSAPDNPSNFISDESFEFPPHEDLFANHGDIKPAELSVPISPPPPQSTPQARVVTRSPNQQQYFHSPSNPSVSASSRQTAHQSPFSSTVLSPAASVSPQSGLLDGNSNENRQLTGSISPQQMSPLREKPLSPIQNVDASNEFVESGISCANNATNNSKYPDETNDAHEMTQQNHQQTQRQNQIQQPRSQPQSQPQNVNQQSQPQQQPQSSPQSMQSRQLNYQHQRQRPNSPSTHSQQQQPPRQTPGNPQQPHQLAAVTTTTSTTLSPQEEEDLLLLQKFWRSYDDIVFLSLFAIFGIVFRMASATWFKMELGVVFSEDSALSTNLPLNCWSCFLLGLLCSGRDAMGIVHAKVLGGANPYGPGRGIIDMGKGAYRGVVDAGRAGINRARGYRRHDNTNNTLTYNSNDINSGNTFDSEDVARSTGDSIRTTSSSPSAGGLHRRKSNRTTALAISTGSSAGGTPHRRHSPTDQNPRTANSNTHQLHDNLPPASSPTSQGSSDSIAGLLGLDDEFRIGAYNNSEDDVRDVQLRALTRRIMASPSLVLFPAKKEDVDVMEHYENNQPSSSDEVDGVHSGHIRPIGAPVASLPRHDFVPDQHFEIGDIDDDDDEESGVDAFYRQSSPSGESSGQIDTIRTPTSTSDNIGAISARIAPADQSTHGQHIPNLSRSSSRDFSRTPTRPLPMATRQASNTIEAEIDEMFHTVSAQISHFRRLHVADAWDVGTTPEEMKHNILLGLRVGFCGAVSTFSSWNSAMINLLKNGKIGEAVIGYMLGIQLGIISYRFGQHLAVYIFVWRCRREAKKDEKRGYGIRLRNSDADDSYDEAVSVVAPNARTLRQVETATERDVPSVRALATSVFVMILISLFSALYFFPKHQQFSISLLFTPFGCLARWKLTNKYNSKLPGFPLGTFACNLLSCALSGSLGSIIAGNPGPEERIVLTSMIAGFAGSLSTFATFIVELLSLIDPIIFKFDGFAYAVVTIAWGLITGICSSQAKNWADDI